MHGRKGEIYLRPKEAARKLKAAYEMKNAAYLYGVTGIGKTLLVREFLGRKKENYAYYSAEKTTPDKIREAETETPHSIVVIDDLYCVSDQLFQEQYAALVERLMEREDVWLVLISRSPVPGWLLPIHVRYGFLLIGERDFYLSRSEQDVYLEKCGICLNKEEADQAWSLAKGHPVSLRMLVLEKGNIERTVPKMWLWLENHVYDQWDTELQEFLMETSIVDCYTIELACMLTGRGNVEELISRAEETGNFMTHTGKGGDGIWEYRWGMRESMRQRLWKKYGKERIRQLYSRAGLYYEMCGTYEKALEMYENGKEEESVLRVLTANARRNPTSGQYFELRKYYLSLPEETVKDSPTLISYMSMLQSILMNEEESERWYVCLKEYAVHHTGSERREAKSWLWYLDVGLPHRGSAGIADIFKNAGNLLNGRKLTVPEFSVTTNLPSLMNGGKDFCEWSRHDRELAASIGKTVESVLGKYGKGLVSLALAESGLEKGADNFEIMRLAEKGRLENETGGKIELAFVAVGILAWLALLNGNAEYAKEMMETFRERAKKEAPRMLPNIDAFLCRIALYQSRPADTEKWMGETSGETEEFCTLNRFQYLTRARIYLQAGKYEQAYGILQQLLYYAHKMKRTYIEMETSLLLAVTMYRTGQDGWKEMLQGCISQAEGYHFVRIFSREGAAALELLEDGALIWENEEYREQVLAECRRMAKYYPGYLSQGVDWEVQLSENALKILRFQAEGLTIEEIAHRLGIKADTVKYHNRENYRKLGVRSRSEAVYEARKRKLI